MPIVDGLEAAKEIPKINKMQRIAFASAYVKQLSQVVKLIQKPFEPKVLIELVEGITTPAALHEINRRISQSDPSKPND